MLNKIKNTLVTRSYLFYGLVALVSALIFCMIYGIHVLNPENVDWLMTGGDLSQHYLGWMSFRNSSWMFPLGMTKELTYPLATSVIFTDSIPVFAVFFKLFRFMLPENFQYFGFWGILCFMLQGCLSAKIASDFLKSRLQILLVSILFVISPVILERMFSHTALAGHWIILLALFSLIKDFSNKKLCVLWCLIGFLTASIHIYFIAINGLIVLGVCLKQKLNKKRLLSIFLPIFSYLFVSSITVWILGGFSTLTANSKDGGLGWFSMNLNAFFNPQGTSYFIKDFPLCGGGQYEGYAYLGAGILFLCLLAFFQFCMFSDLYRIKNSWRSWLPIVFIFVSEFCFATSNKVTFFNKTLFIIPLPPVIETVWSIFRSTGRFSWVCIYIIEIYLLKVISTISKKKVLTLFILFSICLQVVDLRITIKRIHEKFNQVYIYQPEILDDDLWKEISKNSELKHVCLSTNIPKSDLYAIANFVLKNKKTLNRFYLAHGNESTFDYWFAESIKNPKDDSVYVFKNEEIEKAYAYNLYYYSSGNYLVGTTKKIN